jgi:hypothetical protein
LVLGLALAVTTLAGFWPARGFDFVRFDDDINIYNNPHLGELTWARLGWMFNDADYMPRFMPLGWLSLVEIFGWSGLDPAGYHLAGIVLHTFNALLVFTVAWQGLGLAARARGLAADAGWRMFLALLAAAAWALHPLRAEPVAWATGLHYVHATFWALLAIVAAWARLNFHGKTRRVWLGASWLAFACCVLVYPVALGLPVALLAFELWLGNFSAADRPDWRRMAAEHAPYWLLAGFSLLATVHSRWTVSSNFFAPAPSLAEFSLGQRVGQAAYSAVYYVLRPLVPGETSPVYNMDAWRSWEWLCALAVLTAVAGTSFGAKRRPGLAAWLAGFAGVSALFCGWLESPFQPSDRYTYFPCVVLALGGAWLLLPLQTRPRRLVAATVIVIWTGWSAAAVPAALEKWRDSAHLFAHIDAHDEAVGSFGLYQSRLAIELAARGDFSGAESLLKKLRAVGARPEALGAAEARIAELDRLSRTATRRPAAGSRVAPDALLAELNGLQALGGGEFYTAGVRLRRAVEIDPGFSDARYNLVIWLAAQGELAEAFGQYETLRAALGPADEAKLLRIMADAARISAQPVWAERCARRLAEITPPPGGGSSPPNGSE